MIIAPVLANLGPLEELSFTPNPGEVLSLLFYPESVGVKSRRRDRTV